ncbi:MAG: ABC transporter permease [Spirochaetota bacterium]|nr:ABC transporter permease [Spirochaetota bacterium]
MLKPIFLFIGFIRQLIKDGYLIRSMALKNLKQQYVGSFFGIIWTVINPMLELLIYWVVFGYILSRGTPDPIYNTDSFLLFLLCGIIPFQFFTSTVNSATQAVAGNSNLVKKAVGFHPETLPVITIASKLIEHIIGIFIILVAMLIINGSLPYHWPSFILYLLLMNIFILGLVWITSSLNVYMKDISQIVALITRVLFFLTPIFYPPSRVPEGFLKTIFELNPLYHMVEGYRHAFLIGGFMPWGSFLYLFILSVVFLGIGGLVFRRLKQGFAEVL